MNSIIKTENLTKTFGTRTVVNNLNIDIQKGEIFGFLGPNGSGKTTTIKMLCGLIAPTSGTATVNEFSILNKGEDIRKSIGYMSQKFCLYEDLTVMQNLKFYGLLYKIGNNIEQEKKMSEVIELTNLKKEISKDAGKLSGGYKQRLALACALLHTPKILFLDEPTAGIDPVARKDLWDLFFNLAHNGLTLFVTTHYMDEAIRCHKLGYIYDGRLIAYGMQKDLADDQKSLEELFVKLSKSQEALSR